MKRPKLQAGDEVRIIAPSHSLAIISPDVRTLATERLESLGLVVTFGKHVEECNEFVTSAIESRISDLHDAFLDPNVKAIMAVIGGYAANQLLPYLDWNVISQNPKPLIGYSDTTVLQVAMYTKVGIISYSAPAFSTFGQRKYFDFTFDSFKACAMEDKPFILTESKEWTDDLWFLDQQDRHPVMNEGWSYSGSGSAAGTLMGGNLNTLRLLQGTEYFPSLSETILFLEDDDLTTFSIFDRELESLTQLPSFAGVKGLVLGRFQKKSEITKSKIETLIRSKKALQSMPIIYDVDFGHTSPLHTFPIGGRVSVSVEEKKIEIL
jgi:muramoyltetrapeptide carboxypeptidase